MMKKITLLILMLLAIDFGYGQTTLAEGEIVITGVNADNPDQFSFVLLTDVTAGTIINFTDKSWLTAGGWRLNAAGNPAPEGIVTWTSGAGVTTCGTEIVIGETAAGSNTYTATSGTAIESEGGFALANNPGDQVIVYQGTRDEPVFLYAIHFGNNNGWTDGTNANNSAVPAGLTDGVNAMTFRRDNSIYNRSTINNQTLILNAVADASNWSGSNTTRQTLGGALAYTCAATGSCLSTVTWNGAWSGTPDLTTNVIIAANYDTNTNGNFRACSLTVDTPFTLTIGNSSYAEVENDVTINGNLVVETEGNFVQNDNSGGFTVNAGGSSSVNKQSSTKLDWFYYTYWSSPVIGETIADAFPDVDGDRRFWFNAANFEDNNGDDIDDNDDDWQYALGADVMAAGVGYASTSSRLGFFPRTDIATFEGAFNTGNIPVSITLNAANTGVNWNFIGNPYPSAIDFIAFQQANSSVLDGAAYFWSQASPPDAGNPGNEPLNFNLNDYAVFTIGTGGAAGGDISKIPTGYIASGQGFFIPASNIGTATFTNAMRLADANNNNQFFKGNNSKTSNKTNNIENKLWLNLTTGNGVFNQILVGYVKGATDGNDGMSYDAPKLLPQDFPAIIYTLMDTNNAKYVIQGKDINSIDDNEVIKLGFSSNINVATIYKFSIAQFEGDFLSSNTVYLKDNLLNRLHDLSTSDYTFTSETGEFNARFEIVFNANALSTEDISKESVTLKIIELQDDKVQFTTSKAINTIKIFDLLGRQLYHFKGQSNSETYKLSNLSRTVYIAKVELTDGTTITKKAFKK